MNRFRYVDSASGRILAVVTGFAIAGAGVMPLVSPKTPGALTAVLALLVLPSIVGCMFAIGLAIEEHGRAALALTLALPFAGGIYFAGVYALIAAPTAVAIVLLVAGAGVASLALHRSQPISAGAGAGREAAAPIRAG